MLIFATEEKKTPLFHKRTGNSVIMTFEKIFSKKYTNEIVSEMENVGTKFLHSIGILRYPPDEPIHENRKCSTQRLTYILVFDLKWPLEAYALMPLYDNR